MTALGAPWLMCYTETQLGIFMATLSCASQAAEEVEGPSQAHEVGGG